jgi:hypothetical protein
MLRRNDSYLWGGPRIVSAVSIEESRPFRQTRSEFSPSMTGPATSASSRISSNVPSSCRRTRNFVYHWRTSIGRSNSPSPSPRRWRSRVRAHSESTERIRLGCGRPHGCGKETRTQVHDSHRKDAENGNLAFNGSSSFTSTPESRASKSGLFAWGRTMNCTQANAALSDYDVPLNLQPFVEILLSRAYEHLPGSTS